MYMAYNTSVHIYDLEVQFKYFYNKDMGEWRTSGELDNVVLGINCTLSANWNGTFGDSLNNITIEIPPPSPAGFVPLSGLTEDDCKQFLFATNRYWSLMSYLTGSIENTRQTPTIGLCAVPWE